MPTVLRVGAMRFVIWPDDHSPPHVHVYSPEGTAKIALRAAPDCLLRVEGLSKHEVAAALRAVMEHRERLLAAWEKIHGQID